MFVWMHFNLNSYLTLNTFSICFTIVIQKKNIHLIHLFVVNQSDIIVQK